jgi:hypothetical protein
MYSIGTVLVAVDANLLHATWSDRTGSAACFKPMAACESMLLRNHSTLDMRNSGGRAEKTFLGFQLSWMSLDLEPLFQKVAHREVIHDQIW